MIEDQIHWISSNIRIVIAMAVPFALGIAWTVVQIAWKRRISLRELRWLVAYFALACAFALWLRYGRLMPIPGEDWEAEALKELRLK